MAYPFQSTNNVSQKAGVNSFDNAQKELARPFFVCVFPSECSLEAVGLMYYRRKVIQKQWFGPFSWFLKQQIG